MDLRLEVDVPDEEAGAATPLPCGVAAGEAVTLLELIRLLALGGRGGKGRSLVRSGRLRVKEKVLLKSNEGTALRSRD